MKEFPYLNDEGLKISVPVRTFEDVIGVTLCCVTLNEEKRIEKFLQWHRPYVKEIIIIDGGSIDRTVEFAMPYADHMKIIPFNGHFSSQVHRAIELTTTNWVISLDVDEMLEEKSLKKLGDLINQDTYDCYFFPRKNFIDDKPDPDTPQDEQVRLFRSYCRLVRPVHPELVGSKKACHLPAEEGNFIIHSKSLARHEKRNKGYMIYETKYLHEMGSPGCQTKESFAKKYPHLTVEAIAKQSLIEDYPDV